MRGVMEVILLATVVVAPWALGGVEPLAELCLYAAVAVLLLLWGIRSILDGEFRWQYCPVCLCLGGLFLLGVLQTVPLPRDLLGWLSPATAALYEQLLPARQEQTLGDAAHAAESVGRTLSFYPAGSQREALRLLVVLLVFAMVRNNLTSAQNLRRLCVVVLANGAALSLFGIVQMLSSSRQMVFWSWPVPGAGVFGPFICHNHFPFYANMALGLGIGLMLSMQPVRDPDRGGRRRSMDDVLDFIQHPSSHWLVLALGLCVAGTLFSLSRGGLLTLVVTFVLWLILRRLYAPGRALPGAQVGAIVVAIILALGIALAFGYDAVSGRLANLSGEEALEDPRLPMWQRGLTVARDVPIFGSGYGTFQFIEMLHRTDGSEAQLYYDHAHNDYLEALTEGGLIHLALSLIAIFLAWRYAFRALGRARGSSAEGLLWGALFGLTALLVHSFVDFGLHIPAITLLATVVIAQLCGYAAEGAGAHDEGCWRAGGLVPYVATALLLSLGFVICGNAWTYYLAHRLAERARALQDRTDRNSLWQRAAYLDHAVMLRPQSVSLQIRRGRAHMAIHDATARNLQQSDRICAMAQLVLDGAANPGAGSLVALFGADARRQCLVESEEQEMAREHLMIALYAYQQARNACPLAEEPHRVLGRYAEAIHGDARAEYLRRAKLLGPGIPLAWYDCGLQEVDTDPDQALASWRRCLELEPATFAGPILEAAKRRFPPEVIAAELVPNEPENLLRAAVTLYPDETTGPGPGRAFLERAAAALEKQKKPLSVNNLEIQAQVYRRLGRTDDAIAAFQRLVEREPNRFAARYQLAECLFARGRLEDSRRELRELMASGPHSGVHTEAENLLAEVRKQIALGAKQ